MYHYAYVYSVHAHMYICHNIKSCTMYLFKKMFFVYIIHSFIVRSCPLHGFIFNFQHIHICMHDCKSWVPAILDRINARPFGAKVSFLCFFFFTHVDIYSLMTQMCFLGKIHKHYISRLVIKLQLLTSTLLASIFTLLYHDV